MAATEIIKFKEKHGDYYYDISTQEQYSKVALAVLRSRDEEGHWYFNPEGYESYVSDKHKELAAIPEEIAEKLPQDIKDSIVEAKKAIQRAAAEDRQLKAWWKLLRETLDLPDEEALAKQHTWKIRLSTGEKIKQRPMVQVLLESRQDYQYEGFEIIKLEQLED